MIASRVLLATLLLAPPTAAAAQSASPPPPVDPAASAPQPSDSACAYGSCAVRVERPWLGRMRLVVGEEGTVVPRPLLGSFHVTPVLGASASARPFALRYDRFRLESDVVGGAATLLSAVSFVAADEIDDDSEAALAAGTLVLGLLSRLLAREADQALSRAVWWYNRDAAAGRVDGVLPPPPAPARP